MFMYVSYNIKIAPKITVIGTECISVADQSDFKLISFVSEIRESAGRYLVGDLLPSSASFNLLTQIQHVL